MSGFHLDKREKTGIIEAIVSMERESYYGDQRNSGAGNGPL
jgi:hypothetical protein